MPAEKIAFMLFDAGGLAKADAAPSFSVYRHRDGSDPARPVIVNIGLGLYGFVAPETDVLAATAFVVDAGASAFAGSGSTRVFGSTFLQSQPWFVQMFEDGAGALWVGAAPTVGAWKDFAGVDDATKPTVVPVSTGLWAFTPDPADLADGRAYAWSPPAGAYPSSPHGAAHFDPVGVLGETLGELIYAALAGDVTVAALVGTRIFPNVRPPAAPLPVVVYSVISDVPENTLDGSAQTRLKHARLQIDCYGRTYVEAHNVADAVGAVVGNLPGGADAPAGWLDSERDLYDNTTQTHRVSSDYTVSR